MHVISQGLTAMPVMYGKIRFVILSAVTAGRSGRPTASPSPSALPPLLLSLSTLLLLLLLLLPLLLLLFISFTLPSLVPSVLGRAVPSVSEDEVAEEAVFLRLFVEGAVAVETAASSAAALTRIFSPAVCSFPLIVFGNT